jgi:tetratricopeptide (TPR) repeat protein
VTPTSPAPRPVPPPPEVAGFVVHEFLGRGSSGVVWRATQDGTMREVALKVLAPWQTHGLAPLRFEREAEIAASLEHEAIARVFGAGECAAGPWLAMELVDGPPADEWMVQTTPSLRKRIEFFRLVCAGMSHAHQRGVIHRDLKPGNVLVTAAGQPKIVDFGLARCDAPSSLEVSLTREGDFLGTLAWMPPEQASGHWAEVDALSDVHALGAILFALVAGEPPIDNRLPPAAQLAAAQSGERRRLRESAPSAPRDLEAVVARCLAASKSERYQSVAELEADLVRWLAGDPVQAPVEAPLYWIRKKIRRHWPVVAGAGVAGLAAVGMAAGYWQGQAQLEAEKQAALRREAAQKARTLHEAQELVTQLLVEMRGVFEKAGHPEWVDEAERRVAAFPWGDAEGPYDARRFRGRSALVQGDILSSKGQWGGALSAYRDAIEQLKPLVEDQPAAPLFREELIRARLGESRALIKLAFHKEAFHAARQALELIEPSDGRPALPTPTQALVDACCRLGEATEGLPARTKDALEMTRHVRRRLDAPTTTETNSPQTAEWRARLGVSIAQLSARAEPHLESRAAADSAVEDARHFAALTDDGELSGRLLATALALRASRAVTDGDPTGACTLLDQASRLLGNGPIPLTLSSAAHVQVANTWENCASYIASHHDARWALEANDRAIGLWGQIRKRSPNADTTVPLSRLCLTNLQLALKLGDPAHMSRRALITTEKLGIARRDGSARAPIALDTIEAALLMLEARQPDAPDQPTWREIIEDAQRWIEESKTRMTKSSVDRLAALAPRLQAVSAPK